MFHSNYAAHVVRCILSGAKPLSYSNWVRIVNRIGA